MERFVYALGKALHALGVLRADRRGADLLGKARLILVLIIIEPGLGNDLNDRHGAAVHHADRQLAGADILLHQHRLVAGKCLFERSGELFRLGNNTRADGGAAGAGLHDARKADALRHRVAAAERDARRRRDAAAAEKDLAQFLIHGERAAEIAAAGIRHAVNVQTCLQLPVFALRAVQREERDIRGAADLDHAGADQPFAAALGADLVKIGLGLPHGVNGVSGVGRKDAAGIIHR